MSETPRTDAVAARRMDDEITNALAKEQFVPASFARLLERELAHMRELYAKEAHAKMILMESRTPPEERAILYGGIAGGGMSPPVNLDVLVANLVNASRAAGFARGQKLPDDDANRVEDEAVDALRKALAVGDWEPFDDYMPPDGCVFIKADDLGKPLVAQTQDGKYWIRGPLPSPLPSLPQSGER